MNLKTGEENQKLFKSSMHSAISFVKGVSAVVNQFDS